MLKDIAYIKIGRSEMLSPALSRLRLKDLQLLKSIADVRSITLVSKSMGVSQPALSRTLGEIEDHLGIVVFCRDRAARMAPTPLGRLVLERIDLLLANASALRSEIQTYQEGTGGHLRLGMIPYIPSRLALSIVSQLTGPHHRMVVSTYEASTNQLIEALARQELDAVFGRISIAPGKDLYQEELLSQSASMLLHERSDLLQLSEVRLEMLQEGRWVLPPTNSPTRLAFAKVFEERGLKAPHGQVETTSARLIHSLTRSERDVVGLVPLNIGRELQSLGGVRCVEFPVAFKMPAVGLIMMAAHRNMAALKNLRSAVREALDSGAGLFT